VTRALGAFNVGVRFLLNCNWIKSLKYIFYINEVDFKSNMLKLQQTFNCPIVAVGILPASTEYENILRAVAKKNKMVQCYT